MSEIAETGIVVDGRYRLCSVLADGARARVWRARDLRLDREVALKVLAEPTGGNGEDSQRFAREIRAVSALSHPHIIAIYDAGRTSNGSYFVMELARHGTLADLIAAAPLPVNRIVQVARQVCQGLTAAHAAGIIHRDLKPSNILLASENVVKISDFGAAYVTGSDTALTATGMAIGTPPYMSPEQVEGQPVGPWTDLYSLGCVMYAMATGQPPFTGGTPAGIAWRHLHQDPVPLGRRNPAIPQALDGIVSVLLGKDRDTRPASAALVDDWLGQLAQQLSQTKTSDSQRALRLNGSSPAHTAASVG